MKINIHTLFSCSLSIFFCGIFLFSCNYSNSKKYSYIHSIVDTLSIDKSKNIIIYTVNPNDCISCINGFKLLSNDFSNSPNSSIYVISIEREVEKKELIRTINDVDFTINKSRSVLWNKKMFNEINRSLGKNLPLSLVCIYNYKMDSVIYCNPIREINKEEVLRENLEKTL